MPENKAKVIFQPSGRRGEVPKGISVIEASRLLGADIEALCGEKKVCGKCKVRIEEGSSSRNTVSNPKGRMSAPGRKKRRKSSSMPQRQRERSPIGLRSRNRGRSLGLRTGRIPCRQADCEQGGSRYSYRA